MQRHRIGKAANVAGHDGDRAKFSHGTGVAKNHAVEQAPFDGRQGHSEKGLPAVGPQHQRRLFLIGSRRLHYRNYFTRHKRKGHKNRSQHNSRHRENDVVMSWACSQGPKTPRAPNMST